VATTTAAPTTTAAAPTTNASPPPSKPKWAGRTETAYVSNFETCALFTVHEIARQEHVKGEAVTLALHLADGYQPWAHQAAFEGCLDGIPNSWYRYNDRKLYPANVTDRQIRKLTAAGYTASL
jgi:hypothetical protein